MGQGPLCRGGRGKGSGDDPGNAPEPRLVGPLHGRTATYS
jgi:hypothetical protein